MLSTTTNVFNLLINRPVNLLTAPVLISNERRLCDASPTFLNHLASPMDLPVGVSQRLVINSDSLMQWRIQRGGAMKSAGGRLPFWLRIF